MHSSVFVTVVAALFACTGFAEGQSKSPATFDLTQASLEDLMDITVTSVARKDQKLSQAAAAVFVITQDDIRRSGATNIPDVLRMAPGVNVARIDANTWAISIRGFNDRYADKILVLIDSRAVYMPSFSGVYWDQIDVPLEDIERIEIIRGPGGAVWGANAMNGVINIITTHSKATQGGLIAANAGMTDKAGSTQGAGLAQYGGKAGNLGFWRAFGGYSNTDSSRSQSGASASDGWHAFHGGFRTDLETSPRDSVMVQGDLYQTAEGQELTTVLQNELPTIATFHDPIAVHSGDLQARWAHTLQNGSEMTLNIYYNHVNRVDEMITEDTDTFDIDFQHHFTLNSRNDVVWGIGYRITGDSMTNGYDTVWSPPQRTSSLYSGFVQDEIKLAESLRFTLGTKLENNGYSGFEYEPSARLAWVPTASQTLWLSGSQAIRQPDRQDVDLQYQIGIVPAAGNSFGVIEYINNGGILAEQLRDFEGGYRKQINKRLSLDVAAFRGYYSRLETTAPGDPYNVETAGQSYVVYPQDLGNGAHGRTYGGEMFAAWDVNRRWRLSPGFDLIHMSVTDNPYSRNSSAEAIPGDTPKHQVHLRSSVVLGSTLDWDTTVNFVGSLRDQHAPAYTRLDTQLRWRIRKCVELDLTGQNLLRARHTEFSDGYEVNYTQVQRSFGGRIAWRF
jgi:iron complex outermembrane receptor protein